MMKEESLFKMIMEQVENIGPILDPEGLIVLRTPMNPKHTDHTIATLAGPEVHQESTTMWILFYGVLIK